MIVDSGGGGSSSSWGGGVRGGWEIYSLLAYIRLLNDFLRPKLNSKSSGAEPSKATSNFVAILNS